MFSSKISKMIKYFLSIMSIAVLSLASSTNVFADELTLKNMHAGDILIGSGFLSEYDMIRQLQQYSDTELLELGYTEDEIASFRKKASKSPEDAARMAANGVEYHVYLSEGQFYYDRNADKTNLTAYMLWEWKSKPDTSLLYTDIVAMKTSNTNFIVMSAVTTANYYYVTAGTSAGTQTITTYTYGSRTGSYATFPMTKSINVAAAYAKSGRTSVNWIADGNIRTIGFAGNYGHSTTWYGWSWEWLPSIYDRSRCG